VTAAAVAERIRVSRFAVADAERGKPSTSGAVYAALLWVYGPAGRLADATDPGADEEGARLALLRTPLRAPSQEARQ